MSMELPQSLARSGVMPLYAVVGEEDYLRDFSVAALRTAALGAGAESGFNYDIFHGDDSSIADVLACAAEIPVFAERRVVVYKSVEKLPAREGEKLLSYLASPNETTTFIVVGAKLDGRLKWTQALTKRAVTVNCAPLRDAQLSAWIRQEAASLGVRLQEDAIQLLKDVGSESLYAVKRELEKLAAYVPSDRTVQSSDV
ncbi:MAG: DNA polymerase III subunit delta, partial [Nitrospira sp. SCN 59-13]